MEEEKVIKHRNRKKVYDYDIHAKIARTMYERIKEQAEFENMEYASFLRKMIDFYLTKAEKAREKGKVIE